MRKAVALSICFILLTALLSVFPSGLCNITGNSNNIIYVDDDNTGGPWDGTPEHPYQFIRDGINNASSGDTVYVFNGMYHEYVLIPGMYYEIVLENKTINLIGEDMEHTILDGSIWVAADRSNITGFTIQNNSLGGGIFVASNYNTINQNIIVNCVEGIWLCDWYDGSTYNIITNNTITDNVFCGITMSGSSNKIINNTITNNWFAGIDIGFVSYAYDNNILENTIIDNEEGIILWGSDNTNIYENVISNNNGKGIWSTGSDDGIICRNDIMNNKDEGIVLESSSNNIIYGNKITNNKDGISVSRSSENNNITLNIISNNRYGIWLVLSSDNNVISGNDLIENNCGLYLSGSSTNQVILNDFENNILNAFFVNCNDIYWKNNYWDRPRLCPKPIFGIMKKWGLWIPQINFDWRPAREPYDIGLI